LVLGLAAVAGAPLLNAEPMAAVAAASAAPPAPQELELPALKAADRPSGRVVLRLGLERIGLGFGAAGPPAELADGTRRPAAAAAVVRLDAGRLPAAVLRGHSAERFLIEPLLAALQALRDYQQRAAGKGDGGAAGAGDGEAAGAGGGGEAGAGDGAGAGEGDGERHRADDGDGELAQIDLLVDRRVPFATLARVLYTLGRCRYGSWHFVLQRGDERSALVIAAPRYSDRPDRPPRPQKAPAAYRADLLLTWVAEGLRADALPRARGTEAGMTQARNTTVLGGPRLRPTPVQITAAGRCPAVPRVEQGLALAALRGLVASLGAQNDEPFGLILQPLPATPFGELAAVLVAAERAAGCTVRPVLAMALGAGGAGKPIDCSDAVAVGRVLARFAAEAERAGEQEKKVDSGALRDILGGGSD
jgi:hypothetical protein